MIASLRSVCACTSLLCAAAPAAADLQLVRADAAGLRIVVEVDPGVGPQGVTAPGLPRGAGPGGVELPYLARLLAAPPGARLRLSVHSEQSRVVDGVSLPRAGLEATPLAPNRFASLAHTEPLGVLRGVPAHSLHVYPWSFDPATRRLRVHTRLVVDVSFVGGSAGRRAAGDDRIGRVLRDAFLNPPDPGWRLPPPARRPAADAGWYDPERPWVKVFVAVDGLFRITPKWLRSYNLDPDPIDPRTFRLFHAGVEQLLLVRGEDDGSFDAGDDLLFYGRYRRAVTPSGARDHESEYGPTDTYWLTWGGPDGLRFAERDAAPVRGYPQRAWYLHSAHHEIDLTFDQLGFAPDSLADHWFWQRERPLRIPYADRPSAQFFTGDLTGLYDTEDYEARVEISLQGRTGAGFGDHHTVVSFNNHVLEDAYWSGQVSHVIDAAIPSSWLRTRNRVLLQGYADRIPVDEIWFNWFRVSFRRRFHAFPGFLVAPTPPAREGHRITIEGFSHPAVLLLDVAAGVRLTGVDVTPRGTLYDATFEDAPATAPLYVVADSLSLRVPTGAVDAPSNLRTGRHGAHYLILAHPDFVPAASRLAEHRRSDGLQVAVVSSQDVYDEFSYGRFQREAVAEFVRHAYENWDPRPVFLLLLGDETWDYRGIYTGDRHLKLVPTLYYSAPERGYSPTDYRLALVDGDDLLADLSVGRLAVDSVREAEAVVDKVIAYDARPEPGAWRSRSVLAANWHARDEFSGPLDTLAARYTDPIGLQSIRLYAPDETPLPNATGKGFLDALNDGALIVNFSGHGSAGNMQFLFSTQFREWEYLEQVRNGGRLPLVLALSCLNGLFTDPRVEGLSELFTERVEGGAIAYISATAQSRTAQNSLLADGIYAQLFAEDRLWFGPVLDNAKARLLAAHPGWVDVPETMQLLGDPAQKLALPSSADYAAVALAVGGRTVTGGTTVRVSGRVRNNGLLGTDSLEVVLLGSDDRGATDTLLRHLRPPFAGLDTLAFEWPVGDRRGPYRLSLLVDATDRVSEVDEADNRLDVDLDILEGRTADPLWPLAGGESADLTLSALTPIDALAGSDAYACEFALSARADFADSSTLRSPPVPAAEGVAAYTFAARARGAGPDAPLYWRVRLHHDGVPSPWSPARSFRVSTGAGTDSAATWSQRGDPLLLGRGDGIRRDGAGRVVAFDTRPFRPAEATREDGFTVLDLPGAGVLATDGTYLYVKRWYNDASTVYPGSDFFARIGTGFGGSVAGRSYGLLADSTTAGISATFHGDGYLYSDSGQTFELERIDPATGRLDTVAVPDGLLDWVTGRVVDRLAPGQTVHALITSDSRYIYNVSMSSPVGLRVGWGVRVFDPQDGWRLVREFVSPPTENGFTYLWTDGGVADGERLYFVEYGGQRRIRAVSAADGAFLDEWTSDQEMTRVLSGQYDWVNDRVWLGDLFGSGLFRYGRDGERRPGRLVSEPIGPASAWGAVSVDGTQVSVTVEGRGDEGWVAVPGLPPVAGGQTAALAAGGGFSYLRLSAQIDTTAGARLSGWRVEYAPASDLEVAAAGAEAGGVRALVRNRGPGASPQASVRVEAQDGSSLALLPVPALAAGAVFTARFDSVSGGARVRALPAGIDGDPANDVALLPAPVAPHIAFRAWPAGQPLRSGDPLRRDQALLIEAEGEGTLVLAVDGQRVAADSSWTSRGSPRALYQPGGGDHRVQARLVGGAGDLAVARIEVTVSDRLAVANVLVYPHPVRDQAAFTFFLSRAAAVAVDVYALSGRRVRRLGPVSFGAGFGQLPWDARDDGGARLAAGTYLFVLTAESGSDRVRRRAPVVVVR